MKRLSILGSTGSVGRQTLGVVRALPDRFRVVGLAGGQNLDLLAEQIDEFKPDFVYHQGKGKPVHQSGVEYELLSLDDIASQVEVDTVVMATSGKAGLSPTLAAVRAGKNVALANKEALVMAGEIITREAKLNRARILPVDSEHNAIWQCLNGEITAPAGLILTASGGPFRDYSPAQLEKVTPEQALKHPSWQMGKKITIDSASLMNKGLEVIEAGWLFDMPFDKIRVLIHPQSIIHSMVEFIDGSIIAQLSYPDMRLPIQYALSYPERLPNEQLRKLDWGETGSLTFQEPDFGTFPCLKLAIEAGKQGGTCPAVLCASDEVAVELFLSGRIRFSDIAGLVEQTLAQHKAVTDPSLDEILEADSWGREKAGQLGEGKKP